MPGNGELRNELEAVRKGRGVQEPQIRDRMGPCLRQLCGVGAGTPHSIARRALAGFLSAAADDLPGDLRLAANIMFALATEHARHRFLRQRYDALATRWNCDFRTVQRRCDEAMMLICAQLDRPATPVVSTADVFDTSAWYVEHFKAVVLLDRAEPKAIEERTIIANVDGLRRIAVPFGVPRHPEETRPQLDADITVLYGARPESVERITDNLFVQHLLFPRPLRRGERHTCTRQIRLPRDQLMTPRYIHLAVRPCATFELRIKFLPDAPPVMVWTVTRVPEMAFASQRPGRHRVTPDPLGEVAIRFTDLQPGFGYGLAWLPADGH